jgi:hypothetical protein
VGGRIYISAEVTTKEVPKRACHSSVLKFAAAEHRSNSARDGMSRDVVGDVVAAR